MKAQTITYYHVYEKNTKIQFELEQKTFILHFKNKLILQIDLQTRFQEPVLENLLG